MNTEDYPKKIYASFEYDMPSCTTDKWSKEHRDFAEYIRANLIDDIIWLADGYVENMIPNKPISEAEKLLFEIRDKLLKSIDDED